MKKMKSERPWALITGASRGIGLALSESLASEGNDLVLTARNVDDLSKAADRIKQQTGYATKSYVLSFSKALALELRGSGVHLSAVCPGPVATALEDRSGAADSWLYRLPKNTPEKIAHTVCRAIKSHRSVVLPGILSKLLAFAGEMPPRRIALEVNNLLLRSSR
jgi:short-subunit dehydrogenase